MSYCWVSAEYGEKDELKNELAEISKIADAVIVRGNLNVHHQSWLRFSSHDSARGRLLKDICDVHGLRQLVTQPTRGEYLLDLVLSDIPNKLQIEVRSKIADHACILVKVPDVVETRTFEARVVWKYDDANWQAMGTYLTEFDCVCFGMTQWMMPWSASLTN